MQGKILKFIQNFSLNYDNYLFFGRWLVKMVHGDKKQGWVPCQVLQTADEPQPGTGLPGDAAFRRQLVKIFKIYK